MSWTETELAELRRAYASGTLRVSYDGKSGRVRLGRRPPRPHPHHRGRDRRAAGRPKPRRSFAAFSKG